MLNEIAYNFGVVTAATAATFSTGQNGNFRGSANVATTARIMYAIVRNNTGGSVTVQGPLGNSVVGIGERKRIEMPGGARFFNVIPAATTTSGDLTADIGIEGLNF